ncbi:small integral membrane protein 14-like isoform X2 [Aphidius gifuensis]|uniref:small integral membrane protein 14-like isoform X2 n=1 Tax=Aphidius gifuensis TaxID=684658 RepID=UPI001CDD2E8B|nr:small integral membrane protein 14-like isoform X2 [Aphidius gifuensis]
MGDEGFNVCECISNFEMMQRLLSLLRQSQAYCTDNECLSLSRLPAPEENGDFLMIGMAFAVMILLYLFRPNSLRQGPSDEKHHGNSSEPHDDPPAIS